MATVSPELKQVLRRLKLGKMLDTLPERLTLARSNKLGHAAFLELVLADEIDRRDRTGAAQRARAAALDPAMTLESWDDHDAITYDHDVLAELTTLRFVDGHHCAFILGPVGVGKDPPGPRAGSHRVPPAPPRPRRTRRPAVQTAQGITAGQQPPTRDAPADRR